LDPKGVSVDKLFCVLVVSAVDRDYEVLYTLDETHHGRVILIFRISGELESFKNYAQSAVRADYEIKTMIIADDLDQVRAELTSRELIPSGPSRIALECTDFFDEVLAELMTGTIWADEASG
jgi:hypothetical protein